MKRSGLLNAPLSAAVASLGHQDLLVVADAGLPIPAGPVRIDLALSPGLPGFFDVLTAIAGEMMIEAAVIAEELAANQDFYAALEEKLVALGHRQDRRIDLEWIPHTALKALSGTARAIVRSGEFTPYANIVLKAGVCF